jgi:protein phosphatase methylesterase 1
MSDLSRAFAKAKLAALPPEPPLQEEDEGDSSSASSVSSAGTIVPSLTNKPALPLPWSNFFAQELYLSKESKTSPSKFHVYFTPPTSPNAPLFILHHGAGSTAMSFALFALELKRLLPESGILAVEARDHGSVVWDSTGQINNDLHIDLLAQDLIDMINLNAAKAHWTELPKMMLIGHSLGGAVVTHVAKSFALGQKVMGFAVLDVVEGSAMDALKSMNSYLATRPSSFASLDQAIHWHIRSRTLRNVESAKASVPSLLLQGEGGKWVWRTDLSRTEAYWENWFQGMSGKFLGARGSKLLILAGTDRLDKELMIGQMQGIFFDSSFSIIWLILSGKFQLQVFPAAGHFLQEDLPEKTAEIISEFFRRNDQSTLVLPPKVSELIAQGKKV